MTFASDILRAAEGEPIEAIALDAARGGRDWFRMEPDHQLGSNPVTWEQARPVLSYDYDSGYGGQDCHNFWAWTKTKVLSIHEYDGSTQVISVPRNPEAYNG